MTGPGVSPDFSGPLLHTSSNPPEGSKEYLLQYGANQSVNDAAASVMRKNFAAGPAGDAEFTKAVREKVQARVAQIESGEVPTLRGGAPITEAAALKKLAESSGLSVEQIARFLENQSAKKRPADLTRRGRREPPTPTRTLGPRGPWGLVQMCRRQCRR